MSKPRASVSFSDDGKRGEDRAAYTRKALPRLKERFSLGGYDPDAFAHSFAKGNPHVWKDENALKEELLRIFQREKDAMEEFYLGKIQNLLVGFKDKKNEWEDNVKVEREELEQLLAEEKDEISSKYTAEIERLKEKHGADMTNIEAAKAVELRAVENNAKVEKKTLEDDLKRTHEALRTYMETEYEAKVKSSAQEMEASHRTEVNNLMAQYDIQLNDLRARQAKDMSAAEERFNASRTEAELRHQEEKNRMEKQHKAKVEVLEERLQKEANFRADVERALNHEKANLQAMNQMLKEELSRIKDEMERLRRLPVPPDPQRGFIAFDGASYSSRADLPARLREDFDRLLTEYKVEIKEKIKKEKEFLDEKLELEKDRIRESYTRDKAELERKMADDKYRMERDLDRSRDEIEREVERKLKTKHLQESLTDQQIKLNETARRLEEEDWKRKHNVDRESEKEVIHGMINEVRKENEGLRVKLNALEDNNKTLKQLKEEGQQEIERLKAAISDLRQMIQMDKRDVERSHVPVEWMALERRARQDDVKQPQQGDPEVEHERRKLQDLRKELERQEREFRERKNIEDATKIAEESSKKYYENLAADKRRLEEAVKALEQKITSMQKDMEKLKKPKNQSQPTVTMMQPPMATSPVPGYSPVPPALSMDHLDRIDGLLKEKSKLVNTVGEYEDDYRSLERENALLDKKVKDLEWKMEKLQEKLDKGKNTNGKLETQLESAKSKSDVLRDDLEKTKQLLKEEKDKVDKMEEIRKRKAEDIEKLTDKLRKSDVIITMLKRESKLAAPRNDVSDGPTLRVIANSLLKDRRLDPETASLDGLLRSRVHPSSGTGTAPEPESLERIRTLERDKTDLEMRLEEAREALENYSGKLDNEIELLESKPFDNDTLLRDFTDRNMSFADIVNNATTSATATDPKRSAAIENWKLLQQKLQLQRLIERLTKIQ